MTRESAAPGDRVRLFVGAGLSLATVNALGEAVRPVAAAAAAAGLRIRWVAPAAYHVTVKFLGWTRAAAIEAIRDQVGAHLAGRRAFSFTTRGAGAFPRIDRARVLWAGIDDRGGAELAAVAEVVDEALRGLGYPGETRAFHPHVTLGRLKQPGDLGPLLASTSLPEQSFQSTALESLTLYESIMKSKGSEYVIRAGWRFEANSKSPERQGHELHGKDG